MGQRSLRVSRETPGAGESPGTLFHCCFDAAKNSSRKRRRGLGSGGCQGHPAPRIRVEISQPQATSCTPHPLQPLSRRCLSAPRAPGRMGPPRDTVFTQREVKVGGGQGKQNKSILPGTCSLPRKKTADGASFESRAFSA